MVAVLHLELLVPVTFFLRHLWQLVKEKVCTFQGFQGKLAWSVEGPRCLNSSLPMLVTFKHYIGSKALNMVRIKLFSYFNPTSPVTVNNINIFRKKKSLSVFFFNFIERKELGSPCFPYFFFIPLWIWLQNPAPAFYNSCTSSFAAGC